MKKIILLFMTGIISISLLTACGNNDEDVTDESQNAETEVIEEEAQEDSTEESMEEDSTSEESDEEEVAEGQTGSNTMNTSFEVTLDPQTDLRLGDTAIVESTIGTYELTVHTAEIVGTELDGEKALIDELILLEMTFKNIGDLPIVAEDVMLNLGLKTVLEQSDNTNAAASFDSIEFFEGEIAPGEEREAQFIADTETADEYYFGSGSGVVAAGTHNEIRFTILDEEVREE